ncbi:MAG: chemotaxis protein CheW [Candidatus Melainabacteria bacterium]|mgnify:CR=1 FL=1|nr:chemotaxis protein CheW [Candidatus Melainabacteria bacterium]
MSLLLTGTDARVDETKSVPILIVRMGEVRSAFLLDAVVQVFDAVDVGEFPEVPPKDVLGAINVRGLKVPLVDVRRRWGQECGKVSLSNQLVLVVCDGINLCVIVDEVIGTRNVPISKIVRLKDILPESSPHMAVADLEGILILLDADKLFETDQLEEMIVWVETVIG